ncbi:MAG: hypothetical protein P4M08_03245 [Oligoflexia bacterium]|nr:hypothetical protein [Oligoflexia bacterium]
MRQPRPEATKESTNKTREALAGTPFTSGEELKKARSEILEETWRELEKARAKRQLLQKEEYKFYIETFQKGLQCRYDGNMDNLARVFLGPSGIQITINEEMKSTENAENLLGVLIKAMSEAFMANYLKAVGVIPTRNDEEQERPRPRGQSKK